MNRHEGGGLGAQGPASVMTVLANIDGCVSFFKKIFSGGKKGICLFNHVCDYTYVRMQRRNTSMSLYTNSKH